MLAASVFAGVAFTAAFLAGAFLAGAVLTGTVLAGAFFAGGVMFAASVFTEVAFTAAFFAGAFLAGAFFAGAFLADSASFPLPAGNAAGPPSPLSSPSDDEPMPTRSAAPSTASRVRCASSPSAAPTDVSRSVTRCCSGAPLSSDDTMASRFRYEF
ncbi:pentapeptide repeat-containing protein [Mycolicibacterium baixiangningiae]|uniref:pentapeptide repeat-containing protein n=1 Tax=Mycolicibacterium baixiangningiae TaxID=2761578 RepID=UPI0027DA716E|nr:pentapeptide repeat-containing protein [Mycolicibacterium baixiangningiae]